MKTKFIALALIFSVFCAIPLSAQAAKSSNETRYFVKTKANLWKNSFSIRHTFDGGFTADLTDWQLRLAKIFNIEIEPVGRLYVSPSSTDTITLSGNPSKVTNVARIIPSSQVPWGVATVYGRQELEKTSGGSDILIAVLDTGVTKAHPDLNSRIEDCKDFSTAKPLVKSSCDDKNGHGTHVAGIIAADGGTDGLGVYGMAPEAKILAYKVCDASGACWADDIAVAIHAAVDAGAQIINISLGSDTESPLIHEAVNYAGDHDVLIVAAAGNDGPYKGSIDYPAANTRVIGVGAIDDEGNVPEWSSRGLNSETDGNLINEKDLEFVAPGANIESTWKEGYAILSGTSMAAPHIAGLAALIWDNAIEEPAAQVMKVLSELAQDALDEGEDDASGLGMPVLGE